MRWEMTGTLEVDNVSILVRKGLLKWVVAEQVGRSLAKSGTHTQGKPVEPSSCLPRALFDFRTLSRMQFSLGPSRSTCPFGQVS